MAFYPTDAEIGAQAITDTLTTQMHTLGKRIRAYDPTTYGYGEFVYLKGIASTVVGSLVTYNPACPGGRQGGHAGHAGLPQWR